MINASKSNSKSNNFRDETGAWARRRGHSDHPKDILTPHLSLDVVLMSLCILSLWCARPLRYRQIYS